MQTCMWIGNHFTSRGCISTAMAALISHPHTHRVTLVMRKTEKVGYDGCWRQSGGKALKLGQRESQGSKIYLKQHAGFCCCRRRCCLFCLDIIWFVFFPPVMGNPAASMCWAKACCPVPTSACYCVTQAALQLPTSLPEPPNGYNYRSPTMSTAPFLFLDLQWLPSQLLHSRCAIPTDSVYCLWIISWRYHFESSMVRHFVFPSISKTFTGTSH